MNRTRLTWAIAAGVTALLVAATVDAVRSSESPGASSNQAPATERSAAQETTFSVRTTPESLPRCTTRQIVASIDVLGGTATIAVRHVWGGPCHLASLPVRLSVTDRAGREVRLAKLDEGPLSQSPVGGDFAPGFEKLVNITYLPSCDQRGPFTAFVIVGPYSAQRKLSGREVGCFRGG